MVYVQKIQCLAQWFSFNETDVKDTHTHTQGKEGGQGCVEVDGNYHFEERNIIQTSQM